MNNHQVILRRAPDPRPHRNGWAITLSCTCAPLTGRHGRDGHAREVIGARTRWTVPEVLETLAAWHAGRGGEMP